MDENKLTAFRIMLQHMLDMPENSVRPTGNQPTEGDQFAIVQFAESKILGWSGRGKNALQTGELSLNIDFYGLNASFYARQIKFAMQDDYALNELLKIDMGFLEVNNPTDLTALELDQTQRWRVKITLSFTEKYIIRPSQQEPPSVTVVPIGLILEP